MKSKTVTLNTLEVFDGRDYTCSAGKLPCIANDESAVRDLLTGLGLISNGVVYPVENFTSPAVIAKFLFKYGRIKIETPDRSKIFLLTLTHDTDK
jgi:hypothetical protein